APREEELRRGGDDRPAVALERPRDERPEWRECARESRGVAVERRGEVLDEIDLVHVATLDRGLRGDDRFGIPGVVPAALPVAERVRAGGARPLVLATDPAGDERQSARLRRRGGGAQQRGGEPVVEEHVGHDAVGAEESLALQV